MAVKKKETSKKETTRKTKEEGLPSREEALRAFAPALDNREDRVRAALTRLADDPPQVLVLEGGLAEERISMALWYAALLNCRTDSHEAEDGTESAAPASPDGAPCLHCPVCLQIGARIHPDLFVLDGREGSIKIDAIRELRSTLGEAPRGEGRRVVILAEAQSLGDEAANALLKSLEEPRPSVRFLLLTPQRQRLLPTLVSRGWVITLAWPDSGLSPEMRRWEEILATFLNTGRGWFENTGKGALDALVAQQIVLLVQKSLSALLTGRARGPLAEALSRLSPARLLDVGDQLARCQEAIDLMVNPSLTLDWLVTSLHTMLRSGR